jgi:arabinose-5-phosphate isomerase
LLARYHAGRCARFRQPLEDSALLATARRTRQANRPASRLNGRLNAQFAAAVARCWPAKAAIVSGMGKSGHIAGKIAASWPAPARPRFSASGRGRTVIWVRSRPDLLLALSNSGETARSC